MERVPWGAGADGGAERRRRPGPQGLLGDKLCPDGIEGWTLRDASHAVIAQLGDSQFNEGLTLAGGGDIASDKRELLIIGYSDAYENDRRA
jgi:hypothetical protein